MAADLRQGFRLGPYSIEPLRGAVTGPDGEAHHLEPKVMSVLVHLAEHANEPVMRTDILDKVWAGQVAADELLTRAISELRRVLGDRGGDPQYIETIPKKGYRLIRDVELIPRPGRESTGTGQDESSDNGHNFVRKAIILVATLTVVTAFLGWFLRDYHGPDIDGNMASIAIFPFEDLTPGSEFPGAARAISNGIAHRLHRTEGVLLLSTDYVENLLDQGLGKDEIANQLGASHVLTGSYLISEQEISWTAELARGDNASVIWTDGDRDSLSSILSLESSIAEEVASNVGTAVRSGIAATTMDVEPSAFKLYAEAIESLYAAETTEAIVKLTEAVRVEPMYAEARALLAQSQIERSWILVAHDGLLANEGQKNAIEALRLDPNLDAAKGALALAKSNQRQWYEARRYLNQMLDQADPAQISQMSVYALGNLGHWKRAIEVAKQMARANPYGPGYKSLATYYTASAQYALAKEAEELAIAHGWKVDGIRLGRLYAREGNREKASEYFAASAERFGYDADLAPLLADAFATDRVTVELREAFVSAAIKDETDDANLIYWYTLLHYPEDEVFELAKRLAAENRFNHIAFFSDRASRYRSDPRFLETMEEIGIADYWREVELPDFCDLVDGELSCH